MERPFFDHHSDQGETFSRILFYSVLIHYIAFFLMVGNPFLLLKSPGGGSGSGTFDVQLLSRPGIRIGNEAKGLDVQRGRSAPTRKLALRAPTPKEAAGGGPTEAASEENSQTLDEAGINVVNTAKPVSDSSPKKRPRRLPPSLTGPEDCMLKVVGKVCPNGDAGCIQAYIDFCSTLPE